MIQNHKTRHALLLCVFLLHDVQIGAAPKQESAGQQAFKKAQGVIRQLNEEKLALETEKAGLLEQLKKLESIAKQIEPLQGEIQLHLTQAETLRNSNGALEAQLNSERRKQEDLHRKIKEIVAEAKLIQNDNQLLVNAVNEREQWIRQCSDKNRQLVEADHDLVGKYRGKGFWDKVAAIEPFTGIGNVETQNTVETYQFKLEDLKVTAFAGEAETVQQKNAGKEAQELAQDNQGK